MGSIRALFCILILSTSSLILTVDDNSNHIELIEPSFSIDSTDENIENPQNDCGLETYSQSVQNAFSRQAKLTSESSLRGESDIWLVVLPSDDCV